MSLRLLCLAGLLICLSTSIKGEVRVEFDHAKDPNGTSRQIELSNGESVSIVIKNTCPGVFEATTVRVSRAPKERSSRGALETCDLGEISLDRAFSEDTRGWIIFLTPLPDKSIPVTIQGTSDTLDTKTFFLEVLQRKWRLGFTGGFTVSGLTSPNYSLVPDGDSGMVIPIEDPQKRDDVSLGAAAFIHVYHDALPHLAGTFGLGVDEGNRATYYVGPSWRFGEVGALTGGVAFGPVATLPAGITPGVATSNQNALSNLGSRIDTQWFLSISFGLFGKEDQLKKPFEGQVPSQ